MKADEPLACSFRDPSGFLFTRQGVLYRQVNRGYREDYDFLMASGLYEALAAEGLLIGHKEVDVPPPAPEIAYKVLQPQVVQFVSYPYEWCFSQWKDAALVTLAIQRKALDRGMSLKDSSAFNIQFHNGRWTLIDSLSLERHEPGRPWVAYRQFCQHFLAPLALMSRRDARLGQLLRIHLDGVPLDLAARLLPRRTKLSPGLLAHIHLHARCQRRHADRPASAQRARQGRMGALALRGLLDSLDKAVRKLTWQPAGTEWADYYSDTSYSQAAMDHKATLVALFLDACGAGTVWDLGANTGRFSRLASQRKMPTVAFDVDPAGVERNYLQARRDGETLLLPLLTDLTNPSPAQGWEHDERMSLLQRGPAHTAMALALVHHLAIGNNLPLERIAGFLARVARRLIIEFVPKEDPQVQRLLASREDVFPGYHRSGFEAAFERHFVVDRSAAIHDSPRRLYLMTARQG